MRRIVQLKEKILNIVRKVVGTTQLTNSCYHIKDKIDAFEFELSCAKPYLNFFAAREVQLLLKKKSLTLDERFGLNSLIPFCAEFYLKLMESQPDVFLSQYRRQSEQGNYFDIKGVKISADMSEQLFDAIFLEIFRRTLFIHVFFENNYDKNIVVPIENISGHIREYKDDVVDVTVSPGDIVIDAGAWVGDFSAYANYKGCKLSFAFEPSLSTYDALCKTAILNDGNIFPIKIALSNKNGVENFYVFEENSACNRFGNACEVPQTAKKITVKTEKLDTFVQSNAIERIDFIKADIEGAERNLLAGAHNVLKKFAPKLSIATYHLPDDPEILKKIILDANPSYKIVQLRTMLYASGTPE